VFLKELYQIFKEAVAARNEYLNQKTRAHNLYTKLQKLFHCYSIAFGEIAVPVKFSCTYHQEHFVVLSGLGVCYRDGDRFLDCYNIDETTKLRLILQHADELAEAARTFSEKEKAKADKIKEFLDFVEEAFKAVMIAASLKEKK
jgi:hypothetical protein